MNNLNQFATFLSQCTHFIPKSDSNEFDSIMIQFPKDPEPHSHNFELHWSNLNQREIPSAIRKGSSPITYTLEPIKHSPRFDEIKFEVDGVIIYRYQLKESIPE